MIQQVRIQKKKPKLKDLIQKFRGHDKEAIIAMCNQLYNVNGNFNLKKHVDEKFDALNENVSRLAKSFTIQNQALQEMIERLEVLEKRKKLNLAKGADNLRRMK